MIASCVLLLSFASVACGAPSCRVRAPRVRLTRMSILRRQTAGVMRAREVDAERVCRIGRAYATGVGYRHPDGLAAAGCARPNLWVAAGTVIGREDRTGRSRLPVGTVASSIETVSTDALQQSWGEL